MGVFLYKLHLPPGTAADVADDTVAPQPKSPWTPSYSVSAQGSPHPVVTELHSRKEAHPSSQVIETLSFGEEQTVILSSAPSLVATGTSKSVALELWPDTAPVDTIGPEVNHFPWK
jgi:hypothetical protein